MIPNICSEITTYIYSPATGGSSAEGGVAPCGASDIVVDDDTGGSAEGKSGGDTRAKRLGLVITGCRRELFEHIFSLVIPNTYSQSTTEICSPDTGRSSVEGGVASCGASDMAVNDCNIPLCLFTNIEPILCLMSS